MGFYGIDPPVMTNIAITVYGKIMKDPPCYQWGKITISNGPFSIAMWNYRWVSWRRFNKWLMMAVLTAYFFLGKVPTSHQHRVWRVDFVWRTWIWTHWKSKNWHCTAHQRTSAMQQDTLDLQVSKSKSFFVDGLMGAFGTQKSPSGYLWLLEAIGKWPMEIDD